MKRLVVFCVFGLMASVAAYCAEAGRVELDDGSVISAKVVAFENGVYTLENEVLGKMNISASRIKNIEMAPQEKADSGKLARIPDAASLKSALEQARAEIAHNPRIMQSARELANDPQFQEAMKDPMILKAAESRDIKALISNEKFTRLINNAKVKEIQDRFKEGKESDKL